MIIEFKDFQTLDFRNDINIKNKSLKIIIY